MKKSIVVIALLLSVPAFAQKMDVSKIPAAVKSTFSKTFPGVSAQWEKEGAGYEANFTQYGKKTSALFDVNGKWLETETAIVTYELPLAVNKYLTTNYAGKTPKEAAIIKKENGEINYEADVNGMDVIFDQQGKFIKSEK